MSWQDDGEGNLVWVDDGLGNSVDTSGGDTSGGTTDTSGGTTDTTTDTTTSTVGPYGSPTGAKWNADIGWVDANGNKVSVPYGYGMTQGVDPANTGSFDTSDPNFSWSKYASALFPGASTSALSGIVNTLKSMVTDSKGNISGAKLAGIAGGILGGTGLGGSLFQTQQNPVGYTGGIPNLTAVRQQVPGTYDPNRRPGSRGQEYFTDTQFVSPSNVATAQASSAQQAAEMEARNKARTEETRAAPPRQDYAAGGIANLARGTYLAGATDGMADKIPATIENKQPAKLSHGEFVVPADVVSHLGNGNSDAGAQRLYGMMDKVRKARTGTTKQGKQINPNKFMPG